MRTHLLALTLALLPLTACNLYFSGGDDPDPCDYGGGSTGGAAEPANLLRNPETGQCEAFGGGGGGPYPCDDACGPCAYPADEESDPLPGAEAPYPTWGSCDSYCSGLDEQGCLVTEGCRAIYGSEEAGAPDTFQECWQTDQGGPITDLECEGLDAYTCSTLDRCSAVHELECGGGTDSNGDGLVEPACQVLGFVSCHSEGNEPGDGCYGDTDCDDGFHCNAADVCLPPPGGGACPDGSDGCDVPAVCYGYCVPDNDPGSCDGEVFCDALPPECPQGTTPGIGDGCWTGYCIPLDQCEMPAACEELQAESLCIAREDCSPFYEGLDCSCTPEGCDCADWVFDSCNPA